MWCVIVVLCSGGGGSPLRNMRNQWISAYLYSGRQLAPAQLGDQVPRQGLGEHGRDGGAGGDAEARARLVEPALRWLALNQSSLNLVEFACFPNRGASRSMPRGASCGLAAARVLPALAAARSALALRFLARRLLAA